MRNVFHIALLISYQLFMKAGTLENHSPMPAEAALELAESVQKVGVASTLQVVRGYCSLMAAFIDLNESRLETDPCRN